jgi:hypothetical protein
MPSLSSKRRLFYADDAEHADKARTCNFKTLVKHDEARESHSHATNRMFFEVSAFLSACSA